MYYEEHKAGDAGPNREEITMIPKFTADEIDALRLTRHAREKMVEREVTFADLVDALRAPQGVEPHNGAFRFVKGDLVVVVAEDAPIVITVLLRRREQWTSADMRRR